AADISGRQDLDVARDLVELDISARDGGRRDDHGVVGAIAGVHRLSRNPAGESEEHCCAGCTRPDGTNCGVHSALHLTFPDGARRLANTGREFFPTVAGTHSRTQAGAAQERIFLPRRGSDMLDTVIRGSRLTSIKSACAAFTLCAVLMLAPAGRAQAAAPYGISSWVAPKAYLLMPRHAAGATLPALLSQTGAFA